MFSHVMLGASDIAAMVAFYDAVLGPLGLRRRTPPDQAGPAGVIWGAHERWPQFAIRAPFDQEPTSAGNGVMVSFECRSRTVVKNAWEAALRHGGTDEGAPGDRPIYDGDFHAAYVRDPEGNKICFLFCAEFADIPQ